MYQLRLAVVSDASHLKDLLVQMGSAYARNQDDIENRIQSFIHLARHELWVAEEGSMIKGFIAFGCYEQFRLQGCCCHIDTLVVDKAYHGEGIGKALVEIAEAYAKAQGATEIELTTANHRMADGTHAFYKAIGYQDHIDIDCSYFAKQNLLN